VDHLSVAPEKPVQLLAPPRLAPGDQVRLRDHDDRRRDRVTVFFRFFMALPHLIWLAVWAQGMLIIAPIYWVWALIKGRAPEDLHEVYAMLVRYATHVHAFWFLVAEPFPGFLGRPHSYPVDLDVPPPGVQSRWPPRRSSCGSGARRTSSPRGSTSCTRRTRPSTSSTARSWGRP